MGMCCCSELSVLSLGRCGARGSDSLSSGQSSTHIQQQLTFNHEIWGCNSFQSCKNEFTSIRPPDVAVYIVFRIT